MADVKPIKTEKAPWVKPFTMGYVLKLTFSNMNKSIDHSIIETSARLGEFEPGSEKWQEVLTTLSALDQAKKLLEEFQLNNEHIFTKGK